jgi:hypothetical protein
MRRGAGQVRINCKIIPSGHATVVREYARGNLDEAELLTELSALGFNSTEIEWHIAMPPELQEV